MLAVSRAVARGGSLSSVLDKIAEQAARVVAARSASILLLRGRDRFQLAGSYGLSPEYSRQLDGVPVRVAPGYGPSGLAVMRRQPVLVVDTEVDRDFEPWREVATREGYRGLVSVPLIADGSAIGGLNAYWDRPGPWPDHQLALLQFFGEHATHAIRAAEVIDRQHREMAALSRLVRGLREQTHEHANRLHAVGGLLALGQVEEARAFIERIGASYGETYGSISARIRPGALAGLITAESIIARQRGVTLELDAESRVTRLPQRLNEVEAVTVVGNLLANALDAVADMPEDRRRVVLRMAEEHDELVISVRDWGPGISDEDRDIVLEHGYTTKVGHDGVGLPLVADVVAEALGRIVIEQPGDGTVLTVIAPFLESQVDA